jgi:hypothetical protein
VLLDKDRVCGAIDPQSEHYAGDWLDGLRNVTFHYAEGAPRKPQAKREEVEQALARVIANGITGKITMATDSFGDVRFEFADEVAMQWLPDIDTGRGTAQTATLREAGIALARFARRAIGAHLASLPKGVVTEMP